MKKILLLALCFLSLSVHSQDLVVTNYDGPTSFSRYEEIPMNITVKNTGIVSTGTYFYVNVFLSEDDQWQSTDISLAQFDVNVLAAGASFTIKNTASNRHLNPGSYHLIFKADHTNRVVETDENNNILSVSEITVTQPDVDFTFTSFSFDNSTFPKSSRVKVDYVLENLGATNVIGGLYVKFVLSTDATLSSNDTLLENHYLHTTGPDIINSYEGFGLILPPVKEGDYFILASIDRRYDGMELFEETNENNNDFAIPITIGPSDIDIEALRVNSHYLYDKLDLQIELYNNGTTGVGGYSIDVSVSDENGHLVSFYPNYYLDLNHTYLEPLQYTWVALSYSIPDFSPGRYHVFVDVNYNGAIGESDFSNNGSISELIVEPPPAPGVSLNSVALSDEVDDTDQQFNLSFNFTNTGNTNSFNQFYDITITNAENATVHTQRVNVWSNVASNETVNKVVPITLSAPLPVGDYQISVNCANSCYTTPTMVNLPLTVNPTAYSVTGMVTGEEGVSLNSGKLFLYQDDGSGLVKFIQKVVPYEGSGFSFPIDQNKHTLYFIPDPVLFPDYVPTILGKTVNLQESNFFTATADTTVIFEIIKIQVSEVGEGLINGQISSGASGDVVEPLSSIPTDGIPVILISSTGEVVGLTYTDESGFYEFDSLKRDEYQILLAFEPDSPYLMDPVLVDVSEHNKRVDLGLGQDGTSPVISKLLLPQDIVFDEFPVFKYADAPINLNKESNVGLPITYTSSNENIATVESGVVFIKGVGSITITAEQAGNDFYLPATLGRTLKIQKASQTLTFEELEEKTFGEESFSIEAFSTASLPVVFSSSDPEIASVDGNLITIHGAGEVDITAAQPGDSNYEVAIVVKKTLHIKKASQTISFSTLTDIDSNAGTIELDAAASSGMGVSFKSSNEDIVSILDNIATIHKAGEVNITANQVGNKNYLAADEVSQSLRINLVLGLEEFDFEKKIYPNPTKDIVSLKVSGLQNIEIFDITGRKRPDIIWRNQEIDFSAVEAGIYIVKITGKKHSWVERIIKN